MTPVAVFNGVGGLVRGGGAKTFFLYYATCDEERVEKEKEKTNKHESDDMLVNYDFIICHDTQIYYDNMCGSYYSHPFFRVLFLTHRTLKNIHENLNKYEERMNEGENV